MNCMITQTRFLRILSQRLISCNSRVFLKRNTCKSRWWYVQHRERGTISQFSMLGMKQGRSHGAQYSFPGAETPPELFSTLRLLPPAPQPNLFIGWLPLPQSPIPQACPREVELAAALLAGTAAAAHPQRERQA